MYSMSDQLFSNNTNRYFPSIGAFDKLSLTKNSGVIGFTFKIVTKNGLDLPFTSVNDGPVTGPLSLSRLQNTLTKDYWTLTSNGELGGALLLWSKIDNMIAVDARIPFLMQNASTPPNLSCKFVACITDPAAGFAVVSTHGLSQSGKMTATAGVIPITTAVPLSCCVSCTVNVKAGQVLTIRAFLVNPTVPDDQIISFVMQDDTLGLPTVQLECAVTYRKMQ